MRAVLAALTTTLALALLPTAPADAHTCADYPNQAAAQRAADTRDADGDGIYCEALPCPCSTGTSTHTTPSTPAQKPKAKGCVTPTGVINTTFSSSKYPHIKAHAEAAIRKGWPRILILNRPGDAARRDKLLADIPTRAGYDRDEYPPATARGRGPHQRGINPRGWMADVAYVASAENRAHGSSLGGQLRGYCNGTRFKYAWR